METLLRRIPKQMRSVARQPLRIVAESDSEATIFLYDEIGYWGIDAAEFADELSKVTAKTIHLRINSPGGDVFDARAMITAIRAHHARVIAHIDGLAASAASFLALACEEVEIAEGAMIMIHRPWGWSSGTADELRASAAVLDQVEGSMLDDYERKTGKPREELAAMLAAETWLTAEESLEHGFVDRIAGREEEPEEEHEEEVPVAARARRAYLEARLRLAKVS